jgi:hypothetical protein
MGKQAKICLVIFFAPFSTSQFLNLAREQKSLATPAIEERPWYKLKLSCDIPFTHAENACVFRASWAKPRLFSITKVKMHRNALQFD